jgi:hypothetical protein
MNIKKENSEIQTFFVTSYGRTATGWLTSMFNFYPDIYCTHAPTFEWPLIETIERAERLHAEQNEFY